MMGTPLMMTAVKEIVEEWILGLDAQQVNRPYVIYGETGF